MNPDSPHPARRRVRRRRGLTLIECIFATLILSFCAISVTEAVLAAYQNRNAGDERRLSIQLAEQLASVVAAHDYVDAATASAPVTNVASVEHGLMTIESATQFHGYTDAVRDASGNEYQRAVIVQRLAELNNAPVTEVTVTSPTGQVTTVRRMLLEGVAQ